MCGNIKPLFNFDQPARDDEVRAASIQFVRKVSGSTNPSKANEMVFDRAVNDITSVVHDLLNSLVISAPAKKRTVEASKARAKAAKRFGTVR